MRLYSLLRCALVVCGSVALSAAAASSDGLRKPNHLWWTNTGAGLAGKGENPFGVTLAASHSQQIGPHLLTFRLNLNEEVEVLGNNLQEHMYDVGLMYGLCYSPTFLRIARANGGEFALGASMSLSAGVSAVGGNTEGKFLMSQGWFDSYYDDEAFLTVGVPVQAELFLVPHRNVGVGVVGTADFNRIDQYWGTMVCLRYGILR